MLTGVVYPQVELGGDPRALRKFALAAEALGYDHFLMYDHVLGAEHTGRDPKLWGPYSENDPFHEVFTSFAYLAGTTERIEFVTGVLVLPQRQTALVAKQAADIDLFSGGRLRLGVGIGWNWVEFDALEFGDQFRRRGQRVEEQIELLRRLWTEPVVDFEAGSHRVRRAGILPMPTRQIPIWLGGFSEPAFRRAARIADGFVFSAERHSEAVDAKSRLNGMLAEAGRGDADFGYESLQPYSRGSENWQADIEAWLDAGGTHLSIMTMGCGFATEDEHIDAIQRWREIYLDVV